MSFFFRAIPAIFSSPLVKNTIGSLATSALGLIKPIAQQAGQFVLGKLGELAVDAIGGLANKAVEAITSRAPQPTEIIIKRPPEIDISEYDTDEDDDQRRMARRRKNIPPSRRKRIKGN